MVFRFELIFRGINEIPFCYSTQTVGQAYGYSIRHFAGILERVWALAENAGLVIRAALGAIRDFPGATLVLNTQQIGGMVSHRSIDYGQLSASEFRNLTSSTLTSMRARINTKPATNDLGWKTATACSEAYVVFASLAVAILCMASGGAINVGALHHPALAFVLSGMAVSFLALIPAGIVFVLRRQGRWGRTALAFAGYALLFLLLFLPGLVKQKF